MPDGDAAAPGSDALDAPGPGEPAPTEPGLPQPAPGPEPFAPMPGLTPPGGDASRLLEPSKPPPAAEKDRAETKHEVFAEDWWSHARPIFEFHGYFRTRAELFHRFALGRINTPDQQLFPLPLDHYYRGLSDPSNLGNSPTEYGPLLCTDDESPAGSTDSDDPRDALYRCKNHTNAGANLRFRLNPELHVSDNLRVLSQIDLLDNVVLGSTPQGYAVQPDAEGGYATVTRGGHNPMGLFDTTQEPPSAGQNGLKDSVRVKRVWAEYQTPVGELRFGRMPSHWGLGMLMNSGDGYDDDYQTTIDRIMFVTGLKSLDLYLAGGWDFVNEGATSGNVLDPDRQAYDAAQRDDVDQYMLSVVRRHSPNLNRLLLTQGKLVLSGGAYVLLRKQTLANDLAGNASNGANVPGAYPTQLHNVNRNDMGSGYVRRGGMIWIPDLWLQILYAGFRFEAEAVTVQGKLDNVLNDGDDYRDWKLDMWGVATETEFRTIEDKLSLTFKFGWSSGDGEASDANLLGGGGLVPGYGDGLQAQRGDSTYSAFYFHPNYKVDLILHRNILGRVGADYYFRPGVQYDFLRHPDGQKLGGGFNAIWTRASNFLQTPGHKRDLGIELNGKVYFQSKDGSLNDDPDHMGGFYTQLEYGVLFPLGGLGYMRDERANINEILGSGADDLKAAQILRWYLGVHF